MNHASATPFASTFSSLRHHFLFAMPSLKDDMFSGTVTYICDHDDEGALGLVINRATSLFFHDLFNSTEVTLSKSLQKTAIMSGGPVEENRGFILHDGHGTWESSMSISEGLSLTTSPDIIEAIACGQGPKHYFIALGYAGWGPGQLEEELLENAWLTIPANKDIIFSTPCDDRAKQALAILGVSYHSISTQAGHA